MRYILYLLTMALLFVGGMLVGNMYLPPRDASLAAAVSVPPLDETNPALQNVTRELAQQNLETLNQALSSCPVVVAEEKDRLLNELKLRLALENFELKKLKLELEIAKNQETNRTTTQFAQASQDYTQAKEHAEKMADELFPVVWTDPDLAPQPAEQPAAEKPAETTAQKAEPSTSANKPTDKAATKTDKTDKSAGQTKTAADKSAAAKK